MENIESEQINYKLVLKLALSLGYSLQKSGAETYRVEDSCYYVLKAYNCVDVDVYALANFLSITFNSPSGEHYGGQRRISHSTYSLGKLDLLNRSARKICEEIPSPSKALEQIHSIMSLPYYPFIEQILICGFVGFSFTMLIGGSLLSGLYAFCIDVILRILIEPLLRLNTNKMFINILGGVVVSFMAWPCKYLSLSNEMNLIITGSFMYLFPGVALMNSVRDIIVSDYLAGITKLTETILTAIAIAIGSGIAISILNGIS